MAGGRKISGRTAIAEISIRISVGFRDESLYGFLFDTIEEEAGRAVLADFGHGYAAVVNAQEGSFWARIKILAQENASILASVAAVQTILVQSPAIAPAFEYWADKAGAVARSLHERVVEASRATHAQVEVFHMELLAPEAIKDILGEGRALADDLVNGRLSDRKEYNRRCEQLMSKIRKTRGLLSKADRTALYGQLKNLVPELAPRLQDQLFPLQPRSGDRGPARASSAERSAIPRLRWRRRKTIFT